MSKKKQLDDRDSDRAYIIDIVFGAVPNFNFWRKEADAIDRRGASRSTFGGRKLMTLWSYEQMSGWRAWDTFRVTVEGLSECSVCVPTCTDVY